MAENGWNNPRRNGRNASFFNLPKLFTAFAASENDAVVSLTSILNANSISTLLCSFWSGRSGDSPGTLDSRRCGNSVGPLGIANILGEEDSVKAMANLESQSVLFGSQLKIQVPPLTNSTSSEYMSPRSPSDFGIKTRNPTSLGHNSEIPSPTVVAILMKISPASAVDATRTLMKMMSTCTGDRKDSAAVSADTRRPSWKKK